MNVKAGYGRNYLIPQNKAVFATSANMAEFEAKRAELEALPRWNSVRLLKPVANSWPHYQPLSLPPIQVMKANCLAPSVRATLRMQ